MLQYGLIKWHVMMELDSSACNLKLSWKHFHQTRLVSEPQIATLDWIGIGGECVNREKGGGLEPSFLGWVELRHSSMHVKWFSYPPLFASPIESAV
jgi:hypothetical protein